MELVNIQTKLLDPKEALEVNLIFLSTYKAGTIFIFF